ncbi:hypothetical protein [Limosilactobacillus fastidiosus]|uniref:Uncharacterized protein n=1 Tax=Limosilactobacillus fastidiosus TaxID=2759855 RepID=A0A7W3TY29_9LACO|nr:hypothetical protein [Limosilactobacillus fastidiosus]MBB1063170.1 hypothetical protein [Limosilactobacillus fastidiosus]MBB1085414.1 hypothetical protein [Limosilactobacillus fastidiosus]MCD7083716.1 hypothetical protein [Limosilactobacillus fastidiosus]MCD7085396.1 hypothetical protein [Limosilactobacillus fastidiosus]MCD7114839.1 hypothetical protein [Limosilactobacillus fastidiosus]
MSKLTKEETMGKVGQILDEAGFHTTFLLTERDLSDVVIQVKGFLNVEQVMGALLAVTRNERLTSLSLIPPVDGVDPSEILEASLIKAAITATDLPNDKIKKILRQLIKTM